MSVTGCHHTGFQVADLARSLAFYRDLLGFEVVWERVVSVEYLERIVGYPGLEMHQAMLRVPGSEHCLELLDYRNVERTPVDTRTANPGTAHICLIVEDLPGLYARLLEAGVRFVSEPVTPTVGPNTGRLVNYMIDPDGIRVELLQLEPAGADLARSSGAARGVGPEGAV